MTEPTFISTVTLPHSIAYTAPKAECPKHGTVQVYTMTGDEAGEVYARHYLCPKCYIEWIAANVTPVIPNKEKE